MGRLTSCSISQNCLNFKDWVLCPWQSAPATNALKVSQTSKHAHVQVLLLGLQEPVSNIQQCIPPSHTPPANTSSQRETGASNPAHMGGCRAIMCSHIGCSLHKMVNEGRLRSSPHSAFHPVPPDMAASIQRTGCLFLICTSMPSELAVTLGGEPKELHLEEKTFKPSLAIT